MDSYQKVKCKESYELCFSLQNPDKLLELYKIDYIKDKDLELYNERLTNPHPHHPRVINIESKPVAKGAETLYYTVALEHTPIRLEEISTNLSRLSQRPVHLLLAEAIIGFQLLYRKFGAFRVKSNMIGFDSKWITKVWVNSNFAKNHFNPFDHLASDCEESMIRSILDIFESNGYEGEDLQSVETFKEVIKILMEKTSDAEVYKQLGNSFNDKGRGKGKYNLPSTPKNKPSKQETPSFTDYKGRCAKNQDVLAFTDKFNVHQIRIKTPKQSEETRLPDRSEKKCLDNYETKNSRQTNASQPQMNSEDFLIIRREVEVPEFIDESSVRQYLGNTINPYQNKMKFINHLLESEDANQKVKQLALVFEYALTKDPDLYKMLLKHKGNTLVLPQEDKEKVNRIVRSKYYGSSLSNVRALSDEIKRKQMQESYYSGKLSEDADDASRKNIHLIPIQVIHPIPPHRPLMKAWTLKQGYPRAFQIQSDRVQAPMRVNHPQYDDFVTSHSEIPRPDYKLTYSLLNKHDIQPRSHEKNNHENLRQKPPHPSQVILAKNPSKEHPNYRDQVLKYMGKE